MPKKDILESQNKRILAYLQRGLRLTQEKAIQLYKCYRLASRVNDLKNLGHDIKCEMQYNKDFGTKWGEYFIPEFEEKRKQKQAESLPKKSVHNIQGNLFA